jgi:hypothetical protein
MNMDKVKLYGPCSIAGYHITEKEAKSKGWTKVCLCSDIESDIAQEEKKLKSVYVLNRLLQDGKVKNQEARRIRELEDEYDVSLVFSFPSRFICENVIEYIQHIISYTTPVMKLNFEATDGKLHLTLTIEDVQYDKAHIKQAFEDQIQTILSDIYDEFP